MKKPIDYVKPNIGTIGHLLTSTEPTVSLPHGMLQVTPAVTPGIKDHYLADKIYGFSTGGATIMAALKVSQISTRLFMRPPMIMILKQYRLIIMRFYSRIVRYLLNIQSPTILCTIVLLFQRGSILQFWLECQMSLVSWTA